MKLWATVVFYVARLPRREVFLRLGSRSWRLRHVYGWSWRFESSDR